MDITSIQFPDSHFDTIICSHVLEHVTQDRKALSEFFRVLKVNGWALIVVPITSVTTFEDPEITDPQERLRLFGQDDHVRRYGPDFQDRLREGGFVVQTYTESEVADGQRAKYGVTDDPLYFCTKPLQSEVIS